MDSSQSNMNNINNDLTHLRESLYEQQFKVKMLKKDKNTSKDVLNEAISELKHRKSVYLTSMNNVNNS